MLVDNDSLADKKSVTHKNRTNREVQLPRRKGKEGSLCSRGTLCITGHWAKLMGIHCGPCSRQVLLHEDPVRPMKVQCYPLLGII